MSRKILCSTTNQHIKMISEGSCESEDWSNDVENAALLSGINNILKHIKQKKIYIHTQYTHTHTHTHTCVCVLYEED